MLSMLLARNGNGNSASHKALSKPLPRSAALAVACGVSAGFRHGLTNPLAGDNVVRALHAARANFILNDSQKYFSLFGVRVIVRTCDNGVTCEHHSFMATVYAERYRKANKTIRS